MKTLTKECICCKQTLPIVDFGKHSTSKDGFHYYCKKCNTTKSKRGQGRNVEKTRETKTRYRLLNRERTLWLSAKRRARDNNLKFDIELSDVVIPDVCPYLGTTITNVLGTDNISNPSIDRIIPELGYVKGNIEVISKLANMMKSSASKEQLISFANEIIKRHEATKK